MMLLWYTGYIAVMRICPSTDNCTWPEIGGHGTQFSAHFRYISSIYNIYIVLPIGVHSSSTERRTNLFIPPPVLVEVHIRDRYLAL